MTDKELFDAIRARKGSALTQADVDAINRIIGPVRKTEEPSWIVQARSKIGQREIVGPTHNSWIAKGWARLGAGWYNSDETPWCGFFIADCLDAVGLKYPKNFPAASSFRDFGIRCAPQLGAIAVKARKGGNHVFFIVGITADGKFYKGLGGNQSNMVSIADFPVTEIDAIVWPAGAALPASKNLPVMPKGTLSVNEA